MEPQPSSTVIVVGSGPCGLMVALALADAGVPVTLIESGPSKPGETRHDLSTAELVSPHRHAPMEMAVRRGFGGTSALWGGRAVPLDAADFQARSFVPDARWPIAQSDIEPWYRQACEFLDCGPAKFDLAESPKGALYTDRLERWCAQPNIGAVHTKRVTTHPKITLLSDATVTRIVVDAEAQSATGVEFDHNGQVKTMAGRAFIVAAGGVETARLLLASRTDQPGLFGGGDGALGRYYMGHIYGSIANITFRDAQTSRRYNYMRDDTGRYYRRRFMLSAEVQSNAQILNMSAWPEVPVLADARHKSAVLSLGYLALAAPFLGPQLIAPAIRARKLAGGDGRTWPHVWNVLRDPVGAALFAADFGSARYLSKIRKPGFFVLNSANRYSLFHHGEHAPNRDSSITLSQSRDAKGMPRARIDLRYTKMDAESVVSTLRQMEIALSASGLAQLEYLRVASERVGDVLAQASDGFHQIGTARMSADRRTGVVDGNAKVHDIANLFIAGSAIFPTSGQANPTLTAVALAARLADHIRLALPQLP